MTGPSRGEWWDEHLNLSLVSSKLGQPICLFRESVIQDETSRPISSRGSGAVTSISTFRFCRNQYCTCSHFPSNIKTLDHVDVVSPFFFCFWKNNREKWTIIMIILEERGPEPNWPNSLQWPCYKCFCRTIPMIRWKCILARVDTTFCQCGVWCLTRVWLD